MLLDLSVAIKEISERILEWETRDQHVGQGAVLNELRAIKLKLQNEDNKAYESMAKHYEEQADGIP